MGRMLIHEHEPVGTLADEIAAKDLPDEAQRPVANRLAGPRGSGSVVAAHALYSTPSFFQSATNFAVISSTNSCGATPCFSADCWTFCPC